MHCILSDDGKDSNTAKGVNIAIEFKEYEDTFFNKNVIRDKMRRIQSKKIKVEHMKSTKYNYHVLMIKNIYFMMVFIHLLIFTKILKSRFLQKRRKKKRFSKMIIDKKRFSLKKKTLTVDHKWFSQIKLGTCKYKNWWRNWWKINFT